MKKMLFSLVMVFVMIAMLSTVAFAAAQISGKPVETSKGVYSTTINVAGVGASDTVTLLVVEAGTDLTDFDSEDILYVAQKKATSGSANFEFVTSTKAFDVYSGYTTKPRTESPMDIIHVSGPQMDSENSKLYTSTSPYGKSGYRRVFIKLTNDENGNWVPVHSGEGSEIYYSTELSGYDGLVKTSASELGAIFEEITWTEGAPSADQTIAKYGDADGNGRVALQDYGVVKKAVQKTVTLTTKQLLVSDVDDNARIALQDYGAVKNFVQKKITEFKTVTDKK